MTTDLPAIPATPAAPDDAERAEMRRAVRTFCEQRSPESEVRRLMATYDGLDPAVWQLLCDQLAVPALLVPEDAGGAGLGWQEIGIVLAETGAALLCAPVLSTVMATTTLLRLAPQAPLLAEIASGSTRVCVSRLTPGVSAVRRSEGWSLTGQVGWVVDGHTADRALVVADDGDGAALFAVSTAAPGVSRTLLSSLDQTRKLAAVSLLAATGERLAGVTEQALESARVGWSLALAAEQVGGAQRIFELTLAYARTRFQFGRPIGSFQAIKHRCADLALELAGAQAVVEAALAAADTGADDRILLAHLAAAVASESYLTVARSAIQIHGGIGFTWEHPAHLYLKRAKSSQLLLGSPARHRQSIGTILGLVA